jgi:hypothetical protein
MESVLILSHRTKRIMTEKKFKHLVKRVTRYSKWICLDKKIVISIRDQPKNQRSCLRTKEKSVMIGNPRCPRYRYFKDTSSFAADLRQELISRGVEGALVEVPGILSLRSTPSIRVSSFLATSENLYVVDLDCWMIPWTSLQKENLVLEEDAVCIVKNMEYVYHLYGNMWLDEKNQFYWFGSLDEDEGIHCGEVNLTKEMEGNTEVAHSWNDKDCYLTKTDNEYGVYDITLRRSWKCRAEGRPPPRTMRIVKLERGLFIAICVFPFEFEILFGSEKGMTLIEISSDWMSAAHVCNDFNMRNFVLKF